MIPTTLKIGGHHVTVGTASLDNGNGECEVGKNVITLDNGLVFSQAESSLIHEIFHFLNTTLDDAPLGHALLDSLAEQFYQVLVDNNPPGRAIFETTTLL